MKRTKNGSFLKIFTNLIILSSAILLYTPGIEPQGNKSKTREQTPVKKSGFALESPTFKLFGGLEIPSGSTATYIGPGFGLHLDFDAGIVRFKQVSIRPGFSAGYYSFSKSNPYGATGTVDASITVIPITLYIMGTYTVELKSLTLTPYLSLGGGGSASKFTMSGDLTWDKSSFDGVFSFNTGSALSLKSLKGISFFLNFRYLSVFETQPLGIAGIELGAGYSL